MKYEAILKFHREYGGGGGSFHGDGMDILWNSALRSYELLPLICMRSTSVDMVFKPHR